MKLRSGRVTYRNNPTNKLSSLPPNPILRIARNLSNQNALAFYMSVPKNVREVLKQDLLRRKLRHKLGYRGIAPQGYMTPGVIRIVKRLAEINNTPEENNERRGNRSVGEHVRRVQNSMNLLKRLKRVPNYNNRYINKNRNQKYNFKKGILQTVPRREGHSATRIVATGISKRPNGSLYFNLRKRHNRKRNTVLNK